MLCPGTRNIPWRTHRKARDEVRRSRDLHGSCNSRPGWREYLSEFICWLVRKNAFSSTSTIREKVKTMANTQQNDTQNAKIQGLLARYLELRSKASDLGIHNSHLDEDTLNAFTEGNVSEREALPIVKHLSDCGFCRHRTTEL